LKKSGKSDKIKMLPKRKDSLRLKNWDYKLPGPYFITICSFKRYNTFNSNSIRDKIAYIIKTLEADLSVRVHCFVISENHIHILLTLSEGRIISLSESVAIIKVRITQFFMRAGEPAPTRRGEFIRPLWQRSFYDHIIRNKADFLEKARYIEKHPIKEVGYEYDEWH